MDKYYSNKAFSSIVKSLKLPGLKTNFFKSLFSLFQLLKIIFLTKTL